ncbi:hypothetical protein [Janthinobacterium sp. JC611]|nr:hypothetical protein [Janthinobacterium sp. JC611]
MFILILKTEVNVMQELNVNEIEEVSGGLLPEASVGGNADT